MNCIRDEVGNLNSIKLLIAVPIDLSDETAAKLLDFLYEFAHRLESHYSEQLYRYRNGIDERQADPWSDTDPPF